MSGVWLEDGSSESKIWSFYVSDIKNNLTYDFYSDNN